MSKYEKISTLIYATDLGEQAGPVFRHALAMAKQYEAHIIMLHVVEPISDTAKAIINSYLSKELTDEIQKATMKDLLIKMKARLKRFYENECREARQSSPVKEFLVAAGKPSEEILRVAEEDKADMIIMGKSTRKVRGIRVMGSTARRVSRMADVPVLIVPNY